MADTRKRVLDISSEARDLSDELRTTDPVASQQVREIYYQANRVLHWIDVREDERGGGVRGGSEEES